MKHERGWLFVEDRGDLLEAKELLGSLSELLDRERAAVTRLDADAITALAERKLGLIDRLRMMVAAAAPRGEGQRVVDGPHAVAVRSDDADLAALREEVRRTASRLMAHAEANAALLADAVSAVGESLGLSQKSGTYDRRAKMKQRTWSVAGLLA